MKIQAIYFDIGGVLVRTEDRAPRQKLAERLGMTSQELEMFVFGGESGRRAQLGLVDETELWHSTCRQVGWPVEQVEEFRAQFFGGDQFDTGLLAYIRQLHQGYKTGIISNAFNGTRALIEGAWAMTAMFDVIVLSGEVGVMKPDPRIYQMALERLAVQPEQAVFIDDFQHNIAGAQAVGMHGIHFRDPAQALAELSALLDLSP